jgi:putative copper resistance protein D
VELSSFEAAAVAAKALTYAFSFTAAGGAIFILFFSRLLRTDERAQIAKASAALAIFAIVFTALRLPIIAATLGGDFFSMMDLPLLQFAIESSEGQAAAVRVAGLVLVLLLLGPSTATSVVAAFGAVLVSMSFAFTGHSLSLDRGLLPQGLVTVHLLAVSYWLGGFFPLRYVTYRPDPPGVARVMKRYGDVAFYIVGALVVAGFVLLWIMLRTPLVLFDSDYGRAVVVKLLFVAGLLGLAGVNKLVLTPALARGDISALQRLRNSITAEIAMAGLILVVTATFTTVVGPPALD